VRDELIEDPRQILIPGAARPRQAEVVRVATDERYTPAWVLDIARKLGPIAYDPCTTPENHTGARDFSALPEDGLSQDWWSRARGGLVWCNPPFSRGLIAEWADKIAIEASLGTEIVALTGCDPSTKWFARLNVRAAIFAPLKKRVRFIAPVQQAEIKTHAKGATALWYFGPRGKAFAKAAEEHAHLYAPGALTGKRRA